MTGYVVTKDGWIGTDLDGTLAYYEGWKGPNHIGPPIPEMEKRVRNWIAEGWEVRIVTARASDLSQISVVKEWLKTHGFPDLRVVNYKDYGMIQLWDDRCVQVIPNTGVPAVEMEIRGLDAESIPQAKNLADELEDLLFVYESDLGGLDSPALITLEKIQDFLNGRAGCDKPK